MNRSRKGLLIASAVGVLCASVLALIYWNNETGGERGPSPSEPGIQSASIQATPTPIPTPPPKRTLSFPPGRSLGKLSMRNWESKHRMQRIGEAKSEVDIPEGKEVQLSFETTVAGGFSGVQSLPPDAIHILILPHDVKFTDADVDLLKHLTSLKLLFAPGKFLSEEGAERLNQILPGCKVMLTYLQETPRPTPRVRPIS